MEELTRVRLFKVSSG